MRWPLALSAQILRRGHETASEIRLPDSIDHDARRSGIFFVHDPFRQRQSIQGRILRQGIQNRRNTRRYGIARFHEIAALENMRFARLLAWLQDERGRSNGPILHQLLDLAVGSTSFSSAARKAANNCR